jgi:uncharacterized protein DUF6262
VSGPSPLAAARARDSDTRRRRVLTTLQALTAAGADLSVSALARAANVHRSFIHRHPELRAALQTAQLADSAASSDPTAVTAASLRADVANLQAQNQRLTRHVATLERRLSELLGEQVYRASGIGAPDATAELQRHQGELTQRVLDLQQHLDDRTDELAAARAANRELMAELNRR